MEKDALIKLPVFLGLISSAGILCLIFSTWCTQRRCVWAITGVSCVVTSIACAVSRVKYGQPHFVLGIIILFAVGVVLISRSLRPFRSQNRAAA